MSFRRAVHELAWFCRKADVAGTPRLSISFDTERDAAFFERELRRELQFEILLPQSDMPLHGEFKIYGIEIRILS